MSDEVEENHEFVIFGLRAETEKDIILKHNNKHAFTLRKIQKD